MTLGEKQRLFARLLARLLDRAHELGFEVTLGEAWRSTATARIMAEQGRGIAGSLHIDRLAIDLNLFKDGAYLSRTEDHQELGEWWEKQDPSCRWGGRFRDGNHYSIEHNGRR